MSNCLSEKDFATLLGSSAPAEQITTWKRHLRLCDICATGFVRIRTGLKDTPPSKPQSPATENAPRGDRIVGGLEPNIMIGDFRIENRLGSGGMGTVYQALQLSLNRRVALKVLPPGLAVSPEAVKRFHREARAAAKLHHTNIVAIYAEGEEKGTCYYAMEMIEGRSLDLVIEDLRTAKARGTGPQSPTAAKNSTAGEKIHEDDARKTASQTSTHLTAGGTTQRYFDAVARLIADVADALDYAHKKGIIHRDVKPSNLMLANDGRLSLMDFGVARMLESRGITLAGSLVGTPHYMSPEQIGAAPDMLDHRTDIYSLGVTLYELLTLELPFSGDNREQIIARIPRKEPRRPRQINDRIPLDLETICCKALEKDPARRYQSARTFAEDLRRYLDRYTIRAKRSGPIYRILKFVRRHKLPVAMTAAIVLATTTAGLTAWKYFTSRWAQEQVIPQVRSMVDKGKYFDAFELALKAERFVPDDPTLAALWPKFADMMSIDTNPTGAQIYVKRYEQASGKWKRIGRSPISKVRLPRGLYRWKLTKPGYATLEFRESTTSGTVSFELLKKNEIPAEMTPVPGGRRRLDLTGMSHYRMELDNYFIDRYEVTNRQFKQFVDAGGYSRQEYWKQQFVEDGVVLSWSDAMRLFRDRSGSPGPSHWTNGSYAPGKGDYPVGGISWYEAAAYAEFTGKRLPTIYHWSRAGISGGRYAGTVIPHSNFDRQGTARAGDYQGMGNYGTYDMAGNVREWCWNKARDSKRYILGGACNEPDYMFVSPVSMDPFDRSETNGFRCIKNAPGTTAAKEALDQALCLDRDYSRQSPISEEEFLLYKKTLYSYEKTPLNEVIVSSDDSAQHWRHETITFDAAYGSERMIAHLFLPRNASAPYQTVIYFPGNSALMLNQFSAGRVPEFILKSGRAVLYPVYKGTYERNDAMLTNRPNMSLSYRDHVIWWSKDLGRSIDYLELRDDIDSKKLGYYGFSWGAIMGAVFPAVEHRLKACVLVGGGFYFERCLPEVDQINFAPHVKTPVLMLNGRYDSVLPPDRSQKPMFELLGTDEKDKSHKLFESGHLPREYVNEETVKWMDRYLGPVSKATPHQQK